MILRIVLFVLISLSLPTVSHAAWAIDTAWAGSGIGGTGTTIPCTIATINAGTLAVAVFRGAGSGISHTSVADDEGQTWSQAGTTLDNATDGTMSVWYKANHPGGTTVVVTLTVGSTSGRNSACGTYSGLDLSTPLDVAEGFRNNNPGTGTDAITTSDGSPPTVAANGSLTIGAFWGNTTTGTQTPGTNFTQRFNANGAQSGEWLIEDRTLDATNTAVATATTDSATVDFLAYCAVFKIPASSTKSVILGGNIF